MWRWRREKTHEEARIDANPDGSGERQLTPPGDYCCLAPISPDRAQLLVMPGGPPPTTITGGKLSLD